MNALAKAGYSQDDLRKIKQSLYETLAQHPNTFLSREILRDTIALTKRPKLREFTQRMEASYLEEVSEHATNAALGWNYAITADRPFLDPQLEPIKITKRRRSADYQCKDTPKLVELLAIKDLKKRWHAAMQLTNSSHGRHLMDSFGLHRPSAAHRLKKRLAGSQLQIVIFGAGPIGLALANTLKHSFGERITILVIDNRIQRPGVRARFNRHWLTQISNRLLSDLYAPTVRKLFREWGDKQYIGATVGLWETILLCSCHEQGVLFWFDEQPPMTVINERRPHLIFDASGGRLTLPRKVGSKQPHTMDVAITPFANSGQLVPMGIRKFDIYSEKKISAKNVDGWMIPQWKEQPIKLAMFKITGIPPELYEPLLDWITPRNRDRIFYLWFGRLVSELNELLLLVNLKHSDFQILSRAIPSPTTLGKSFHTSEFRRLRIDPRIAEIAKFMGKLTGDSRHWGVEPPFLYAPRFRAVGDRLDQLAGAPVIPIGDSLFNGHPKVGNGLGSHLQLVRKLHDMAILHY